MSVWVPASEHGTVHVLLLWRWISFMNSVRCTRTGKAESILSSSCGRRMTQWHALCGDARSFIRLPLHVLETEHSEREGEREKKRERGGLNGSPQPFSRSWIINSAEQFTEQITKTLILVSMGNTRWRWLIKTYKAELTQSTSDKHAYVWTLASTLIFVHTCKQTLVLFPVSYLRA